MTQFIPIPPEIASSFGKLKIRQDLVNYSITIGIIDFEEWDVDTEQIQISKTVIHFIQPNGELVELKVFS